MTTDRSTMSELRTMVSRAIRVGLGSAALAFLPCTAVAQTVDELPPPPPAPEFSMAPDSSVVGWAEVTAEPAPGAGLSAPTANWGPGNPWIQTRHFATPFDYANQLNPTNINQGGLVPRNA